MALWPTCMAALFGLVLIAPIALDAVGARSGLRRRWCCDGRLGARRC
jgi:hypothetical protein